MKLILSIIITLCYSVAAFSQESVDYAKQVKPLLKARCYACHAALKQESSLRLDTGRLIRQGGDSGAAVAPGKPDLSLLIERVSAEDASDRMPPEEEPLMTAQIDLLRRWIERGALSPEDEQPEPDPRAHWAFRPPQRSALPSVDSPADESPKLRNPIDAFVEHELTRHALTARPAARKHVVLRRVYLDLIGLPPTRRELLAFLADESPNAYQRVVDRLLNSSQYGERWARHWMDVWRYSDWYGRRNVPDVWNSAPQIWRWRDWIVGSLNEDKGYDQMIREMLAADEICPEDPGAAVATGYLIRNWYALNPNDWMRNNVEHTGKAFLGLTFNCAHCHDHKYDPITQDEYFRLRAFFEPMYVRQDRVPGEADPGPFQDYNYSTLRKIQQLGAVRVFDKTPDAPTWFYTGGDERNRVTERGSTPPGVPAFLSNAPTEIEPVSLPPRAWYPGLNPAIRETVLDESRRAVAAAESQLAAARKVGSEVIPASGDQLAGDEPVRVSELRLQMAEARLAATRAELASIEARLAADRAKYGETLDADSPALARKASRLEREATQRKLEADVLSQEHALAVAEAKPPSDGNRAKEIEAASKQLTTARAALEKARSAAADAKSETYTAFSPVYPQTSTGRRRALAEWITCRDNPLTARVAVNHIWMRHFHAPLVSSVYDFGLNGASPRHPELLDWLAVELMESGWSMKHVHRLIVTSETYRRATAVGDSENGEIDIENELLWRMNTGRMEAEVVRDSLLYCGGLIDVAIGGQPMENSQVLKTYRRSLYYEVHPEHGGASQFSALFDAPNPLDCYRRTRSIVPQQALALTNSDLVHQVSRTVVHDWEQSEGETGSRAGGENGKVDLDLRFITEMFERILTRTPNDDELQLCFDSLNMQRRLENQTDVQQATTKARESLVRALLNHNDFIAIR